MKRTNKVLVWLNSFLSVDLIALTMAELSLGSCVGLDWDRSVWRNRQNPIVAPNLLPFHEQANTVSRFFVHIFPFYHYVLWIIIISTLTTTISSTNKESFCVFSTELDFFIISFITCWKAPSWCAWCRFSKKTRPNWNCTSFATASCHLHALLRNIQRTIG